MRPSDSHECPSTLLIDHLRVLRVGGVAGDVEGVAAARDVEAADQHMRLGFIRRRAAGRGDRHGDRRHRVVVDGDAGVVHALDHGGAALRVRPFHELRLVDVVAEIGRAAAAEQQCRSRP